MHLEIHLHAAELLILSGSLPPGLPNSTYAEMIRLAARHGIPVLADIHSEPLREAVPLRPWLLKPNLAEFHELIGYRTHDMWERVQASHELCQTTGIILALSMAESGVLLTTPEEQWLLTPPSVPMYLYDGHGQNVIGCGDALVGALAYEYCQTRDILSGAKLGLAAAHFNLSTPGVPEINAAQVRELMKHVQVQRM